MTHQTSRILRGRACRADSRTSVRHMLACAFTLLTVSGGACAAEKPYPAKPLRLVCGGGPGGGWDLATRLVALKMRDELGQPVIVDNRPGADGIIAANVVAGASPDGYTLMPAVSAQMTMNPLLHDNLTYNPRRDFEPVSLIGIYPLLLVAAPALPVNSVRELIAHSKSGPTGLSAGVGSSGFHFATELFRSMSGAVVKRIPYKGSAQTVNALLAGEIQLAFVDVPPAILHVRTGRLKALAVTTARRVSFLGDVPTLAETGVTGYELVVWIGMFAPARTPQEIIVRLQRVIAKSLENPEIRDKFAISGILPASSTPQALAERIQRDIDRLGNLARTVRMNID